MNTTKNERPFPDDHYDEKGIYIPRLYGKPFREWYTQYGCKTMTEIKAKALQLEEERMNIVGQNGNVGYEDLEWKKPT